MTDLSTDLNHRLLFILHRGMVETRNLAYAGRIEQIAELADALEFIPGLMANWDAATLESVRFALEDYERKYPTGRYDYSRYLDEYPVPDRF